MDGTPPKMDSKYYNFNVSVTVCRLSLTMILLLELFQLRDSSIYSLQEKEVEFFKNEIFLIQ